MSDASAFEDHPAWSFALTFYDRPGVATACLELQDEHGLDVPVILVMCWLAEAQQRSVSLDTLDSVVLENTHLKTHIAELRAVRRKLKTASVADPGLAGTYRAAHRTELMAENLWIRRLGDAFANGPEERSRSERDAAGLSLGRYAERAGETGALGKLESLAERLSRGGGGARPDPEA